MKLRRLKKVFSKGPGAVGLIILMLLGLVSLFPQMFTRQDPYAINTAIRLMVPSTTHPFGTDELGRDLLSRVVHGSSISLGASLLVVGFSAAIGMVLGMLAGFYEGPLGELIMRVADLFIAFPGLIIAMAVVSVLGASLIHAMMAVIVIWWPQYARIARGQVLLEKGKPYVEAARAIGRSEIGILWHHALPNCWMSLLVKGTLDIGAAILLTASLSFLGLGAKPPFPELGALVTEGRNHLIDAWWYSTFPGLVMFFGVFGFNLFGDSLRDALDPTLSKG